MKEEEEGGWVGGWVGGDSVPEPIVLVVFWGRGLKLEFQGHTDVSVSLFEDLFGEVGGWVGGWVGGGERGG